MNVPPSGRMALLTRLFLVFSAISAVVIRSLPFRNYLDIDGNFIFFGPDCYDHLRRVTLGIKAFPGLPPYDYYYGYPVGTGQIWAPLFDYLLSAAALLLGWGTPSTRTIEAIGFWLPPVLSFFTVLMVYHAGTRFFGRRAGLAAAAVLALLPAHILYSFVSRLDHHVAEPLICLAIIISLLKGMERIADSPCGVRVPLATAFWMVFALLVWRGSVIFWGIVFIALVVQVVVTGVRNEASRKTGVFAMRVHLFAALLLVPLCALNLWGTAGGVTSGIVSWFHVLLLAACALVFFLLGRLTHGKAGVTVAAALGVALLLGAIALPAGRAFFAEFLAGIEVIVGSDPWLGAISELISILYYQSGALDLWFPVENFSLVYWLFPLILALLFLRWRRDGWREFRYPLFLVWGGLFWLLPLFRLRYCHLTAVTVAIGAGFLFASCAEFFADRKRLPFPRLLAATVLLALLVPIFSLLKTVPSTGPDRAVKFDLMVALRWLRDNTPVTSFFEKPATLPEYGVLADWGLGAHIVNVAQRPSLATNFGWETHGLYESAAFQSLGDPAAAEEILRKNGIRYILLNQVIGVIDDDRAIAAYAVQKGKISVASAEGFSLLRSMYYRLLVKDGGGYEVKGIRFAALGRYRLIYESFNTQVYPGAGEVSLFKIFEWLPGAVISGSGPIGAPVALELRLNSPVGRVLTYRDQAVVGSDGWYQFRVPYATTVASGILKPLGEYALRVGGRVVGARVTEDDVYGGRVVVVR